MGREKSFHSCKWELNWPQVDCIGSQSLATMARRLAAATDNSLCLETAAADNLRSMCSDRARNSPEKAANIHS
jgi:hypothetical protein